MDIVKDFLEKGKIKMDNGIPLPLEKLETTPYKKYKKVSMLTLTNRTSQ